MHGAKYAFLEVEFRLLLLATRDSRAERTPIAAHCGTTARSDGKARRIALSLAGGAVVTSLGGLVYLSNHVGGSEGLLRTANFYSLAIPKYIEYRMHMMMNSPDEVWCVILAKFGSS